MKRARNIIISIISILIIQSSGCGELDPIDINSLILTTDKATYNQGEVITITIQLINLGDEKINYEFSSSCQVDIIIADSGNEIWSYIKNIYCAQALTEFTLAPGEEKTFQVQWNQTSNAGIQVPSAKYTAHAVILLINKDPLVSDDISFSIL